MNARLRGLAGALAAALLALLCLGAKPKPIPYRNTASIADLLPKGAHAGDCDQCHTMHGEGPVVYGKALVGPNQNTLCDQCHDTPWAGGSYAGTAPYAGSAHGGGSGTVWPGPEPPPRTEVGAAGKCLNCHDPHGWTDQNGIIPSLGIAREENLCLTCHDGAPATTNIAFDLDRTYRHPVRLHSGRHKGALEQRADFAAAPVDNRHAECEDCHNPHLATGDHGGPVAAPNLSRTDLGVSRVRVQNGAPGTQPTYTLAAGPDTLPSPVAEYELCFKCHSSFTTQPTGQSDLALQLNPANASYHPVEAAGRDPNIPAAAFVPGWDASRLTRCGDCHGSDAVGGARGPHGSSYRFILSRPYDASPAYPSAATANEMCFACHSSDVYANPAAPEVVRAYSRFSAPAVVGVPDGTAGHAEHVGAYRVPCYACHVTHGAPYQGHLIATGRTPGLMAFLETSAGGTCTTTCHDPRSYTVKYAR